MHCIWFRFRGKSQSLHLFVSRLLTRSIAPFPSAFVRDFLIDAIELSSAYPLPTSGCLVGITVLSRTFASFGRLATVAT